MIYDLHIKGCLLKKTPLVTSPYLLGLLAPFENLEKQPHWIRKLPHSVSDPIAIPPPPAFC